MIFKKGNPGCPCCNCPCSCYKFDDDATDCAGNRDLTATSAEYVTGKLDKAAKFNGSSYYEHADHCCYRLGPDGIAVWFWIHPDYAASYNYGGAIEPEGVISKGAMGQTGGTGKYDFDGEWGVFFDFTSTHPSFVGQLFFVVGNGDASGLLGDVNYVSSGLTQNTWTFYYFWVSIEDGKLYLSVNGAASTSANLTGTQTLTSDKPLHIGQNTDGKKLGEQTNGGVARPILIDNVGFCRSIKSEDCMEARASKLYNSGTGLACSNGGM
tara:strand:+ start:481 stop:1281 length:801 start_codon:yes stop_codon:yes gene_type:complete